MRYCLLYWTKVYEIQFKGKKNESWWMTNINWEISFIDEIKIQRRNSIFYGFYQPRATNIIEHFLIVQWGDETTVSVSVETKTETLYY